MPELINRIVTAVAGAPFVDRVTASKATKQTGTDAEKTPATAIDVNELLQPKKRARKTTTAPKRKAAAKSKAQIETENAMQLREDVVMTDGHNSSGGVSRPRWWVDDLLCCLAHAAGSLLALCCIQLSYA